MDGALHLGNTATGMWNLARFARTAAVVVIGAYIVLSPLAKQILGVNTVLLRQWAMFSGVGVGILKGSFEVRGPEPRSLTPLELLGFDRYPLILHYQFPDRVFRDEDLPRVAARFCATLQPGETVSFDGWVGTRHGWRRLELHDVCSAST